MDVLAGLVEMSSSFGRCCEADGDQRGLALLLLKEGRLPTVPTLMSHNVLDLMLSHLFQTRCTWLVMHGIHRAVTARLFSAKGGTRNACLKCEIFPVVHQKAQKLSGA